MLCAKVLKKKTKNKVFTVWLSEAKVLNKWSQLPKFPYQRKGKIDICTL